MPPAASLGELVGLLIALPFVALADWFKFIKQLPPGQQELAKASHGVGMLALVVFWFGLASGSLHAVVRDLDNPVSWIPAGFAVWGIGWFVLNARYGSLMIGPPQRGTIIVRALIKIALGWAVWAYTAHLDLSGGELFLRAAALWCMATGGAKFVLLIWGSRRHEAYSLVARDIEVNQFRWDDEIPR